jgi:OFA family oxalate/formate antiporter-like MFS transporter
LQGVTLLALSTLDTPWQLAAGAASVGFNFGGNFALFPSLTADLFGTKNFGANYGWVFTSYGVAGVMGVWAGNLAQQATGSYFAAFAVAAALCFASALLAMVLGRRIRRPQPAAA